MKGFDKWSPGKNKERTTREKKGGPPKRKMNTYEGGYGTSWSADRVQALRRPLARHYAGLRSVVFWHYAGRPRTTQAKKFLFQKKSFSLKKTQKCCDLLLHLCLFFYFWKFLHRLLRQKFGISCVWLNTDKSIKIRENESTNYMGSQRDGAPKGRQLLRVLHHSYTQFMART